MIIASKNAGMMLIKKGKSCCSEYNASNNNGEIIYAIWPPIWVNDKALPWVTSVLSAYSFNSSMKLLLT